MEFFRRGKKIEGGENFIKEKLNTYAYMWALASIFISFLLVFRIVPHLWNFLIDNQAAIETYTANGMSYENALYSRISLFGLSLLNIFGYVLLIRLRKAGYYLILTVAILSLFTDAFYFDGFQIGDLRNITGFVITTALLMLSGENNSWKKLS